ncbi:unnamed protein product [Orchesella dallaii]|uniref:Vitelline membrane outer layer protein 1 n=1 Tax=Orchesella dallaii TaxID=48710 RepID=A0ABP1RJ62_9HEXA
MNSVLNFAIIALGSVPFNTANVNITSSPVTNWGVWGQFQKCPPGSGFVQGFQLKRHFDGGIFSDETGLNAIRLFCGDKKRYHITNISSTEGELGEWGRLYSCFPGYLNGFQLRVMDYQKSRDDMATTNVRFLCTNLANDSYLQGDGLGDGNWGEVKRCNTNQVICGIQTQVDRPQRSDDDTSLNNVLMECCDYIPNYSNVVFFKFREYVRTIARLFEYLKFL